MTVVERFGGGGMMGERVDDTMEQYKMQWKMNFREPSWV